MGSNDLLKAQRLTFKTPKVRLIIEEAMHEPKSIHCAIQMVARILLFFFCALRIVHMNVVSAQLMYKHVCRS